MDNITFFLLLTGFLNLILGILVINGGRKLINITYGLNILTIVGWTAAMIAYRAAPAETAVFWTKILYISPTLIASSFLVFAYIFPSVVEKHTLRKSLLIFALNAAMIAVVAYGDTIISSVNIREGQEKEIIFGRMYWAYALYIVSLFSSGFFRLFRRYQRSNGVGRLRVMYLLFGYALAANLAFVTNLIMPWLGHYFLNWIGQVFTVLIVGFTSYAILRYRLMDIRIVVRKIFIWSALSLLVYLSYIVFSILVPLVFQEAGPEAAYVTAALASPFFVWAFLRLNEAMRRLVERYFFVRLHSHQEAVSRLASRLNHLTGLEEIVGEISATVRDAMGLGKGAIVLCHWRESQSVFCQVASMFGFTDAERLSAAMADYRLLDYLRANQRPLVREEFRLLAERRESVRQGPSFREVEAWMAQAEAAVCLPLANGERLIGLVVLGDKISGDAFTAEDMDLLDTLSKQAGVAVDNALLYREVRDLNEHLEERVSRQTREIKEKTQRLEGLLRIKSEFMDIASHQLKTPITVVRGWLSLLITGEMDEARRLDIAKRAEAGMVQLDTIVSSFLAASRMEGGEMAPEKRPGNLFALACHICDEKRPLAEARNLYLDCSSCLEGTDVHMDADLMVQAISNLIDNAIAYTETGGVAVSCSLEAGWATVEVADTGIGIPDGEADRVFEKFTRGTNAARTRPNGSGLGLFVTKRIIEAHGGSISVDSRAGRGTTFRFWLPVS